MKEYTIEDMRAAFETGRNLQFNFNELIESIRLKKAECHNSGCFYIDETRNKCMGNYEVCRNKKSK